jgi:hypothetical protein
VKGERKSKRKQFFLKKEPKNFCSPGQRIWQRRHHTQTPEEQKFLCWDSACGDDSATRTRQSHKSFLLLFFKKEALSSPSLS